MEPKKTLREIYLRLRKEIDTEEKKQLDEEIAQRFLKSSLYQLSNNIMTYVSINFEVDTRMIIEQAFKDGKNVFVPYCTKEKGVMEFYKIDSLDELTETKFGTLEPEPNQEKKYKPEEFTICLVPGLIFDKKGYRIGYGGGYYDRYLSENDLLTLGLIYDKFVVDNVLRDDLDIKVKMYLTDKKIYYIF